MYEAAFKNIDNTLREDDGCGTELDYIEQTSWVLFLKYLGRLRIRKGDSGAAERRNLHTHHRWGVSLESFEKLSKRFISTHRLR